MPDLIKLLPEGASVIAVIVVVVLFLKQQREQNTQLKEIATTFNNRIDEVVKGFQAQIDRITGQVFEHEKAAQLQIQRLFDQFIAVSKETIQAVVELKGAVESLSRRIDVQTMQQPQSHSPKTGSN